MIMFPYTKGKSAGFTPGMIYIATLERLNTANTSLIHATSATKYMSV